MTESLAFQNVQFEIIDRNGEPWVRLSQIAIALGYGQGGSQTDTPLRMLYTRHADEFTPSMTALVKLPTEGGEQEVRIFSLRGCHLLAMFARTPVAKEFRKWVLDVLDNLYNRQKLAEESPCERKKLEYHESNTISPAEQAILKLIADNKLALCPKELQRKARAELWSRFNQHFRIARYSQLPHEKMEEACSYLIGMDLAALEGVMSKPGESRIGDILTGKETVEQLTLLVAHLMGRMEAYWWCVSTMLANR